MPDAGPQPGCGDAQKFVPGVMTETVIHCLEPVEINAEHGEQLLPALRPRQSLLQPVFSECAVGQASQSVVTSVKDQTFVHVPVISRQRHQS